ncbi:MAG: hypothetical protein HY735_21365 [Verrucomicrobia bacterium]|nr:hypothetical protein [Verrucomicrobiota bacterium]
MKFYLLALVAFGEIRADSNIDANQAFAWGENIGWTHWRPTASTGADIGEFVCAGFIYGANVGWINLGSGRPATGIYYRNDSAADFGVNHDQQGRLWGFAYGANIGWINFETNGAPRIDLQTGKLSGFAYGANVGWINLGDSNFSVRADSIHSGADSDKDGMADAWERIHAGDLATFTKDSDTDLDGAPDWQEYIADTNPRDPSDYLRITSYSATPFGTLSHVAWNSRISRQYRVLTRLELSPSTPWVSESPGLLKGNGGLLSVTLTNLLGTSQSFIQIEAARPLAR